MITIKSKKKNYGINFPTSVSEITPDVLKAITESVKLPKHYCIVALAFETKVFDFCAAMNSNKNTNVAVTPVLAKISDEDSKDVNALIGDKIIMERSCLERGVHLNLKTSISSIAARNYFNSDPDLAKAIIMKNTEGIIIDPNLNKSLQSSNSPKIIVLEFKICPVNDIAAAIPDTTNHYDPFVVVDENKN